MSEWHYFSVWFSKLQIPPNVSSLSDFVRYVKMDDGSPMNLEAMMASSDFRESVSGAFTDDVQMAHYDACTLRPTTYEIPKNEDPKLSYFPPCTRVPMCGGCSPGTVQECTPVSIEQRPMMVMVTRIPAPGSPDFIFESFEVINIPVHTACEPRCRVTQEHCNEYQDYLPHDCRCVCRERFPCPSDRHRWDEATCSCTCSEDSGNCPGFSIFNPMRCRCELRSGISIYEDRQGVSVELTDEELQDVYNVGRAPTPTTTTTTTTTLAPLVFHRPSTPVVGTPCQPSPGSLPCLLGMRYVWTRTGSCSCGIPSQPTQRPTLECTPPQPCLMFMSPRLNDRGECSCQLTRGRRSALIRQLMNKDHK
ncbi:hypothetical protein FSP39_003261 [Pinctada imbricata]|uniref:Platelet-derived growth factor (PDGF) family profile domain-containing protein n=1 Tax=Pinctada imbricata TaxID=66713 RepID=A0AA88Y6X5_PINIB|nr:hypothetical protein FSP39_003261 [Pinctada imbricata]